MIKFVLFSLAAISCVTAVVPLEYDIDRIANGIPAAAQQFPYVVSIQLVSQSAAANRGHICGGVLYRLSNVVTTASCIFQEFATPIAANQLRVFAGSTTLTNDTTNNVRNVANITIHPEYTGAPAYAFDVAVLGLVTAFDAATVTPINLPRVDHYPIDFATCQTAGFGGLDNVSNTVSGTLRYANKYIFNQILCTLQYNFDAQLPNVLPVMICASSYNMLSPGCQNDRGNPLVCDGVLTGLLSVTNHCNLANGRPEIYTRVSNFTTWINSVSSAPTFFPGATMLAVMLATQFLLSKISQ